VDAKVGRILPASRLGCGPGMEPLYFRAPGFIPDDVEVTGWRSINFNEAYRHRVWNLTDEPRVVMVFDVLRPGYEDRALEVCGGAAGAMAVVLLETKVPILRHLPQPARLLLHHMASLAARLVLRVRDGLR
jgi:Aspartyl/Asparaginyl beta-hydroxylase